MRLSLALTNKYSQEASGGASPSAPTGSGVTEVSSPQNCPACMEPHSEGYNIKKTREKKKKKKVKSVISLFNYHKCLAGLIKAQVWNAENLLKGIIGEAAIQIAYQARSNPNILSDESSLNNAIYTSLENWTIPNMADNETDLDDTANQLSKDPQLVNNIKESINSNIDYYRNLLVEKANIYLKYYNSNPNAKPAEEQVTPDGKTRTMAPNHESVLAGWEQGYGDLSE